MKGSAGGIRFAKIGQVKVFDDRVCRLGEGPHYDDRTDRAMWVDILGERLLWRTVNPEKPETEACGEVPVDGHPGAAVPRTNGGLVLCLPDGPTLLDPDGTLRMLGTYDQADAAAGRPPRGPDAPKLRSNDAKADPYGRLWVGTMAYDETPGAGCLYRLDPGVAVPVLVVDGVTVGNGLGWSPDARTMYYIDTPTRRVDAFDFDPASVLSNRRALVQTDPEWGFPDGMTVDAEGGLWVAFWAGSAVRRFLPDGSLDRVVELATPLVTSCAFAGQALDQLIITTALGRDPDPATGAGQTYVHRPGDVVGRPVDRFAG